MSGFQSSSRPRKPRVIRPEVPDHGAITAVRAIPRDKHSRGVIIGRKRIATLLESDIEKLGLKAELELTPELAQAIAINHEYRLAWRSAMLRLSRKARSTREIQDGLRRRRHHADVIDRVIARLEELGLLDDEAYATSAAASLARQRPASSRYLESKLRQRGIEPAEAARAAKEAAGDPLEAATTLARKAMRSLRSCDAQTRHRRLWGRLARRGFDAEVINMAIRRAEDDSDS
jgi:regulatory protein